jgi:hypothetical protein
MKKYLVVPLVLAGIGLGGCGGGATSNAEQIRQVETQMVTAYVGSHPEDACRFYTDAQKSNCLKSAVMLKAFGLHLASMLPHDWKNLIAHAKVTVTGNTATAAGVGSKSSTHFEKVGGNWLVSDDPSSS